MIFSDNIVETYIESWVGTNNLLTEIPFFSGGSAPRTPRPYSQYNLIFMTDLTNTLSV